MELDKIEVLLVSGGEKSVLQWALGAGFLHYPFLFSTCVRASC